MEMAVPRRRAGASGQGQSAATRELPVTTHTGVNAASSQTRTVLVSALLEVTGQVRFGDGTDIATTVTEKDTVLGLNGETYEKAIWAGTKRRGVDRRTIHEFRDQSGWDGPECYIPRLCTLCPTCWLFGFTGTTQQQAINAKSRILYATSISIEETSQCLNRHSRNQVDEKSQTTAGAAGIHEEEVIVAGTHFPVYTSLIHALDWEIGVFSHALLENLNTNRYTAASRAQGGIRFADHDGEAALVVDESLLGVFPLPAPKIPSWQIDYAKALALFLPDKQSPISLLPVAAVLRAQGFEVKPAEHRLTASAGNIQLVVEAHENQLVVQQGPHELMRRHYGNQALGYLRQKQIGAQKTLATLRNDEFAQEAQRYTQAVDPKNRGSRGTPVVEGKAEVGAVEEPREDE